MSRWFYEKAGTPTGPFSEADIRELYESSVLRPHTRIRREGATDWIELDKAGLDMSAAAHAVKSAELSRGMHRHAFMDKTFPRPGDGHGPHFTTHGGRIEFHAPCQRRKPDCVKMAALVLLGWAQPAQWMRSPMVK